MLSNYRLNVSNDDLQPVTVVPYRHAIFQSRHHYHHHRRQSCCSIFFPIAFERAAKKSILDPRFDSTILEFQYQSSAFPQIRLRYRYALIYVILSSLIWLLYHFFVLDASMAQIQLITLFASYAIIMATSIFLYGLTFTKLYRVHTTFASIVMASMLIVSSLTLLEFTSIELFSPLGHFSICIEIIILTYTMLPLRLWQNCAIAAIYSILFEIESIRTSNNVFIFKILLIRILLHLCVHLVGFHILIMNVSRMRGVFIEVGQNLLVRRQLEMEKQLKEKMIHSVMPAKVSDKLLRERSSGDQTFFSPANNVKCLFRPFHMASMDNVSILFADIVGFTKMSSKKTAEQLVEILNDLFERFDDLCILNGCEKISTLGDCYYCVAGCPEPRSDHAICCVEMGLGMIGEMRLFDTKRHEGVTMRVGIHTGTVLCGIVGTKRVKFDVWSNDVSLANRMESTGKAGRIHVSEKTFGFLEDNYIWESGDEIEGLKTYYILRRRSSKLYDHLRPKDLNLTIQGNDDNHSNNATKLLSQSATNLTDASRPLDTMSPSTLSTGVASSSGRVRATTFSKLTRYLRSSIHSNNSTKEQHTSQRHTQPPPEIFISTKSLPDSLTSNNPSILNCCPSERHATIPIDGSKMIASDASVANETSNKSISTNLRQWKLPKYLRKFDNRNNNNVTKCNKECVMSDGETETERNPDQGQSHQLLPIIVQKANTETSLCTIDRIVNNCLERECNILDGVSPSCSPSPRSNSNINNTDIIDIRSYISQSRSDITPFYPERADSCKYRTQRSHTAEISPIRRPRAKTLALTSQENFSCKMSESSIELKVPNQLIRKHSQYANNSNSNSNYLQLPEMPPNHTSISQERLSIDDLASWVSNISDDPISAEQSSTIVISPNDEIHLDPIRKQSDLQLVKCVKENARSQQNYLVTPPISKLTLFFRLPLMEEEFRNRAHQINSPNGPPTIALPMFNTYFDIFIGAVIFSTVSFAMFLLSASEQFHDTPLKWLWIAIFVVFTVLELCVLGLFTKKLFRNPHYYQKKSAESANEANGTNEPNQRTTTSRISVSSVFSHSIYSIPNGVQKYFEDRVIAWISPWYKWHIFFGFLMSLPAILTLAHFLILNMTNDASVFGCHYGFLMLVCIVHFCNFTQLSCWMRSILAVLAASAFIGGISVHQIEWTVADSNSTNVPYNKTFGIERSDRNKPHCFEKKIDLEIYLDLALVLILVWFLNREFEIFYRFAFYSSSVAEKDKIRVQSMKNQADLLLQNIIPKHVADHLKNTAKYSENHHNVAIIFASLINFNELYDESYLGGREYLRVLNELIIDFDELLSRPQFSCVEKIKTIGSTFMAASGLDNSLRDQNSNDHINGLMEFAFAMQEVVAEFNKDLLEFDLILRIGFNVGDVTAGVIGTNKLLYDIWGDSVNVSSRMDSTGCPGRIQISKDCIPFLNEQLYEFEPRGQIFVKGKDDMEVYLVKRIGSNDTGPKKNAIENSGVKLLTKNILDTQI